MFAFSPLIDSFKQSDLFGKLIFFSLFALSILSWIIILYKFYLTKQAKTHSTLFDQLFSSQKKDLLHLQFANQSMSPFSEIFHSLKTHAIKILDKNRFFSEKKEQSQTEFFLTETDLQLIESHLVSNISKQARTFEKHLFVLSTIITLAPFMGLLGTVWGILLTFSDLSSHSLNNSHMLSGLSMALGTTVLGLLVAIPALIGHNFIKNMIREYQKEMEGFAHKLLTTLEMQYRKAGVLSR